MLRERLLRGQRAVRVPYISLLKKPFKGTSKHSKGPQTEPFQGLSRPLKGLLLGVEAPEAQVATAHLIVEARGSLDQVLHLTGL